MSIYNHHFIINLSKIFNQFNCKKAMIFEKTQSYKSALKK